MRRAIITSTLLALLLPLAWTPFVTADDVFNRISAEAIHEEGSETFHAGLLYLHAENTMDLENEDAVILFERQEFRWTTDGRLEQTMKRSVLIRTEYGLDHFADLRIPWDGARQKLTVDRLRTLRFSDDETIDAGPTAVVETLPFAVDRAPDYCHLRETMLLHDGVELPCVLETIWTIEDTEPFRSGASDLRSLMLPEPAVISQFALTMPAGMAPVIESAGGAPEPQVSSDAEGNRTWTVTMAELAPRPRPNTRESIRQQPRVYWSTWKDWGALAADITERLDNAAVLDDDLRTALNKALEKARTPYEKARLTAGFIDRTTRLVGYGSSWWPEPRPAARTWSTGYGHRVDRAVLAATLFRETGLTVSPAWRSAGYGDTVSVVPELSWSDGIILLIMGNGVNGWFDPRSATFNSGSHVHIGRTVWYPAQGRPPLHQFAETVDRMAVRFDLAFDAEQKVWAGTGVLQSEGSFNLLDRMTGFDGEGLAALGGFIGTILGGAKVTAWNPERFHSSGVAAGFSLELPAGDRDGQGRLGIELAAVPADHFGNLYQESRDSDVHLPAAAEVVCELHLDPGGLELVHLPPAAVLENGIGTWSLESSAGDDDMVLVRRLTLPRAHYTASQWPELRALLLAQASRAGRVLYFK